MKKIISMLLTVVMFIGLTAVLAGCGAPKDNGAQINIYLGNEVCDFDPSDYYADSTAEQVMSLLFEPLFRLNSKGKLEMAAAESYEVDEEEREIVITLRETYWSDDVRVKAADFVYAWCERILNPNNPNPAAALFYEIENAADVKSGVGTISDIGVRATGIYELTITYREGGDYKLLLENLASVATSPLRQDIVDTAPSYWSKMINTMIFSGPFKVRTYDASTKEFSLERNKGYHQSSSAKNFMKFVVPGTLNNSFTAAGESIEISYADIENRTTFFMCEASLADRAANKDKAVVTNDTSAHTYVFNTENPLFAIPEVRQALLMSIDREAIAAAVTFGVAADGILPDICGGSDEKLITSADVDGAKALLANVNLANIKTSFTITHADNERDATIASMVADVWNSLGYFEVKTRAASTVTNEYVADNPIIDSGIQTIVKEASFGNRNFDVLAIDWQFYSRDALTALAGFTSSVNGCGVDFATQKARGNIAGYINLNFDSYIVSAMQLSGEAREEALANAEAVLCADAAVCPIIFNQSFAFVSSELDDVKVDGFGNFILTEADLRKYEDYLN